MICGFERPIKVFERYFTCRLGRREQATVGSAAVEPGRRAACSASGCVRPRCPSETRRRRPRGPAPARPTCLCWCSPAFARAADERRRRERWARWWTHSRRSRPRVRSASCSRPTRAHSPGSSAAGRTCARGVRRRTGSRPRSSRTPKSLTWRASRRSSRGSAVSTWARLSRRTPHIPITSTYTCTVRVRAIRL